MASARHINRRGFLQSSGGVIFGIAGMQLLAACAPSAPPAGTQVATAGKVKLPTLIPMANLPKPDLPGTADGLVMPGYLRYPANLTRSVPQPPGSGGEVNAITVSLSPAPTPLDQNPAWQQVNKEL